jgi:hypothetical protein
MRSELKENAGENGVLADALASPGPAGIVPAASVSTMARSSIIDRFPAGLVGR